MKFVASLLLPVVNLWSQSAIYILQLPPPGAEGYQSLQSGGAFSEGSASMYYNPALLSNLARISGSQFQFTQSSQDLLPPEDVLDFNQQFWGAYVVAPDPKYGFDLGVGFFRNHVNLGRNYWGDNYLYNESVYGMGVGIRLGLPISLGATVKFYDSHFSPQLRAYGWAFDFGAMLQPRMLPLAPLGIQSFTLLPSTGFAWQNMGPDAFYNEPEQSDPIPTTLMHSLGLKLKFADAFEISVGVDRELGIHGRTPPGLPPAIETGYSVLFLGYRYSQGWLDDEDGYGKEWRNSHALELNLLRIFRFMKRMKTGDFHSKSEALSSSFPFRTSQIFGIPFRANPRFILGTGEIHSRENWVRNHRRAIYWSLSL